MKIHLVSRDPNVERLCREGLAKLCGADWSLQVDPEKRVGGTPDLSILDADTSPLALQEGHPRNGTACILLYNEEQVRAMRGALPATTILLKPLQREPFLTVLAGVIRHCQARAAKEGDEAGSRGDQETMQRLLHTNLELQRAHVRQMYFLSRGLHDLRAPLTAIEGYSRLLLAERFGPLSAAQRENLRRMQQSIGRLSRMTTDIFRLSLGERTGQEPDLQPGDLARSIRRVLDEMMPLAQARTIRLVADVSPPTDVLNYDAAQIHSVLANLVENACRFTPRSGCIEVRGYSTFWERRRPEVREAVPQERRWHVSQQPNAYQVEIRDSGLGIAPQHLESIFEPYTSYAGSQDRAGSGLGLAISRMVISNHRGRISAESGAAGAVFSFVLPFAEKAARPERRRPHADLGGSDSDWSEDAAEGTA